MDTPLNASASAAGSLMSSRSFEVPQFQREYAWGADEVKEFWTDLRGSLATDSYFLGLLILTEGEGRMQVVDGQQRLLTLTLLANALHHEAVRHGRDSLANQIRSDFLRSIDYDTDETHPRIRLSDITDDATLERILKFGFIDNFDEKKDDISTRLLESNRIIFRNLRKDLSTDPFRRLGIWSEFITKKLYFAVFVHPDPASAYQVYEVINTRGKELTTAHLLKNYVLNQTAPAHRQALFEEWTALAKQFADDGGNNFVQYIRHAVTVSYGHVLPKNLFSFLAARKEFFNRAPIPPAELMNLLRRYKDLYLQMIDPSLPGPASREQLDVFNALNKLGVIAVRPLLLATFDCPNPTAGMYEILKLVVRRVAVGNLGTGNVERRFGEAARDVSLIGDWSVFVDTLQDLSPRQEEFKDQFLRRSFNKSVAAFLRRSAIEQTTTPSDKGELHYIWTDQTPNVGALTIEDAAYWSRTIGNSVLLSVSRRPLNWNNFPEIRQDLPDLAHPDEPIEFFENLDEWSLGAIEAVGTSLAESAVDVWY